MPLIDREALARLDAELSRRRAVEPPPPAPDTGEVAEDLTATLKAHREECARFEALYDLELAGAKAAPSCPKHPNIRFELNRGASLDESFRHYRDTGVVKIVWKFWPCAACRAEIETAQLEADLIRVGCPENLKSASLSNWNPTTESDGRSLKAVIEYAAAPAGVLAICSPHYGCGKTHLAIGVLRERRARGIFITNDALLRQLRSTYELGGTTRFLDRLSSTRLLVIDDLGMSTGGSDEMPAIHSILDSRYRAMLPTVITANFSSQREFEPLVGPRLYDRLRECVHAFVILEGQSMRRAGRENYLDRARSKS